MKTLSIKQPWAYLICSGIKDIENRTWQTKFRGRVLVHASAKLAFTPDRLCSLSIDQCKAIEKSVINPHEMFYKTSAIIGSVEIVDCDVNHESIWAEKKAGLFIPTKLWIYNWVLTNPILFDKPILNVKGKLSLWDYNMDAVV